VTLVQHLYSLERETACFHFASDVRVKHEVASFVAKVANDEADVPALD
jgi:hypothetical protein